LILGDEASAVAAATKLRGQNIFVPAIRYPTVARGVARLRVTLTAAHTQEDVLQLSNALKTLDLGL
jgi:7-keto-8-aminopelargonate synthetase-like enzyme